MEMAVTNNDNFPPGVPRASGNSVSPKTDMGLLPPGQEYASTQPLRPPSNLHSLCLDFMRKVNSKFGEQSQQRAVIVKTLHDFRIGQVSKQRTHNTMSQVLGTQEDLQHDLLNILDHPEANWAPGDFIFSQLPVDAAPSGEATQTPPGFMQPQCHPQLPTPYISSEWSTTQYHGFSQLAPPVAPSSDLSFIPAPHMNNRDTFQGTQYTPNFGNGGYEYYGGNASYLNPAYLPNENMHWNSHAATRLAPSMSLPLADMAAEQHAVPFDRDTPRLTPYTNFNSSSDYTSLEYNAAVQPEASYIPNNAWQEGGLEIAQEGAYPHQSEQLLSPAESRIDHPLGLHHDHEVLSSVSPCPGPENGTNTSTEGVSLVDHALEGDVEGNAAVFVENQSNQDNNLFEPYPVVHKQNHQEKTNTKKSPPVSPSELLATSPEQETAAGHRVIAEYKYIHAICGARFRSRYNVKKHHWGHIMDDVNTKTGCWHKNGRPDRVWDEDPSCAQDVAKPRTSSKTQAANSDRKASGSRAPVAPSMIPDLKDLPSTVEELVNVTPSFSEPSDLDGSQRLSTRDQQGMDSLLSAVNVVSNVYSPQPHNRRNDSLLYNSNSQASAVVDGRSHAYPTLLPRTEMQMSEPEQVSSIYDVTLPPPTRILASHCLGEKSGKQLTTMPVSSPGLNADATGFGEAHGSAPESSPAKANVKNKKKGGRKASAVSTTGRKRSRAVKKADESVSESLAVQEPDEKKTKIQS